MNSTLRRRVLFAASIAALFGVLTLLVQRVATISANPAIGVIQRVTMVLLLPGIFGSIALSGNVHAFSLGLASAINAVIYFGGGVLLGAVYGRIGRKHS